MSRGRRTPAKNGFVSNIDTVQSTSQATSSTMASQKVDHTWVAPWFLVFLLLAGVAVYRERQNADMELVLERQSADMALVLERSASELAKLRSSLMEASNSNRSHLMISLDTAHKCYKVLHQASKFLYRTISSFNQTQQQTQDQTLFRTILNTLSQSKSSGAEDLSAINRYDTTQLEECEQEMEIIRYEIREFGDQLIRHLKPDLIKTLHQHRDEANSKVALIDNDSNDSKN